MELKKLKIPTDLDLKKGGGHKIMLYLAKGLGKEQHNKWKNL